MMPMTIHIHSNCVDRIVRSSAHANATVAVTSICFGSTGSGLDDIFVKRCNKCCNIIALNTPMNNRIVLAMFTIDSSGLM